MLQEERQRTKERDQNEVESTSSMHSDMPVERILEAEKRVECKTEVIEVCFVVHVCEREWILAASLQLQLRRRNCAYMKALTPPTNLCTGLPLENWTFLGAQSAYKMTQPP